MERARSIYDQDSKVIGRQELDIYYPSTPNKSQRDYLAYSVQEGTRGAMDPEVLIAKLDAFIADPTTGTPTGRGAERSLRFANEQFDITFWAKFPEPNVRGTGLHIALKDSHERTSCN